MRKLSSEFLLSLTSNELGLLFYIVNNGDRTYSEDTIKAFKPHKLLSKVLEVGTKLKDEHKKVHKTLLSKLDKHIHYRK